MIHIVLYHPEIPQNTGNIARSCAATGAKLHLIKPLGFSLEDKYMKRAGLDYWGEVAVEVHASYEDFLKEYPSAKIYFFSKKGRHVYTEIPYPEEVFLLFGPESVGLPEGMLAAHEEAVLRMPMKEGLRSLNLSNAVAVALYEVLRQNGFAGLETEGPWIEK